jgi:triacylglycerol lipase
VFSLTAGLSIVVVTALGCGDELVLTPDETPPAPGAVAPPEAEPAPAPEEPTIEVVVNEADPAARVLLGPPYPVILVHGFSGFHELGPLEYFFGVLDRFEEIGEHDVYAPSLPPYNHTSERALVLAEIVDDVIAETGRAKVHLIAHSQGGVDSRRLVTAMGYADKVASITTVASPHRGTPLGDAALAAPDGVLNPAGQLLSWLIGKVDSPPNDTSWDAMGDASTDDPWDPDMPAVAAQLSEVGMAAFNAEHPDPEGVTVFSVAAYSNLRPAPSLCDDGVWDASRVDAQDALLVGAGLFLSSSGDGTLLNPRANDGIVPTDSMVWGNFLGCVPADHFDEVGQIADVLPNVVSGFDHLELFESLLRNVRAFEQTSTP